MPIISNYATNRLLLVNATTLSLLFVSSTFHHTISCFASYAFTVSDVSLQTLFNVVKSSIGYPPKLIKLIVSSCISYP